MIVTEKTVMVPQERHTSFDGCEACAHFQGTLTILPSTVLCNEHRQRLAEARREMADG